MTDKLDRGADAVSKVEAGMLPRKEAERILKHIMFGPGSDEPISQVFELEDLRINEYHPLPDGEPTEIHLAMVLKDVPNMFVVLRLKSRRACDELIEALVKHRDNVWPPF